MVTIIWSLTDGGAAISDTLDHGNAANGTSSTVKEIFVRHTGSNEITSVGLYLRQFSGTYSGTFSPSSDQAEFLAWGDGVIANAFGGVLVNFLATTAYPSAGWATVSSKSPSGGSVHRTGVGDSEANAITIPISTGALVAGEIISGSTPNVRFKMRIDIPTNEDTMGIREFDHVLTFNYTS